MATIENLFSKFHLDTKATSKELEIAYNTLTKGDLPQNVRNEYRKAFEYLMINFFGEKGENISTKEQDNIEECYAELPIDVQADFDNMEKELNHPIPKEIRIKMATQKICAPMFLEAISKNNHKFMGLEFWTKKDINKTIKECLLNPFVYKYMLFEIRSEDSYKARNTKDFIKSLKKILIKDENLCKIFKFTLMKDGVVGEAILEEDLVESVSLFMKSKCKQMNLWCNVVIND